MRLLKQSSTAQSLVFLMVQSSDHIAAATGLSPTVTLSKNGGSFSAPAGAVSEIGNGWYAVAGNATDTGMLGPLVLHATATGADPSDKEFEVVAFDPQDSVRMGQTAIPNVQTGNAGALLTSGTGTAQLSVSGGIAAANLAQILGTALSETSGQIAAAFKKFFNVANPTLTASGTDQTGDAFAAASSALSLLQADRVIDVATDPTQYHEVWYVSGTSTALLTKKLYDIDGVKLNSTSTVVGQAKQ